MQAAIFATTFQSLLLASCPKQYEFQISQVTWEKEKLKIKNYQISPHKGGIISCHLQHQTIDSNKIWPRFPLFHMSNSKSMTSYLWFSKEKSRQIFAKGEETATTNTSSSKLLKLATGIESWKLN